MIKERVVHSSAVAYIYTHIEMSSWRTYVAKLAVLFLFSQERKATEAASLSGSLVNPSQAEKAELSRLFSHSSSILKKHSAAFDPMAECVALPQLKKKKSVIRPVSRDVVVFPQLVNRIPHKVEKNSLKREGRIKSLVFKRTMSASQV